MNLPAYITTSWDDGHPLDLRLAELLGTFGLPATFYFPLANEAALLTPSQMRELSGKFEIGAHTVHHCDLLKAPREVARREITACKVALEQIIGRPCTAFCFPLGHFRRSQLAYVRDAGYRVARTVELMSLEGPRRHAGLALMPTTLQAVPAGFGCFVRNSLKRLRPGNLFRYLRYGRADWVATAEVLLQQVVASGGVFHLWGHSREIDQMNQWENVKRVCALLAQCRGRARFVDNTTLADTVQGEGFASPAPLWRKAARSTGERRPLSDDKENMGAETISKTRRCA